MPIIANFPRGRGVKQGDLTDFITLLGGGNMEIDASLGGPPYVIEITKETNEGGGSGGGGIVGDDGKSAYQIAREHGFVGTETEWLASLKGQGVPAGGGKDQILAKRTSADFDFQWITPSSGTGSSGSVTMDQVDAAIQQAVLMSWEKSYG